MDNKTLPKHAATFNEIATEMLEQISFLPDEDFTYFERLPEQEQTKLIARFRELVEEEIQRHRASSGRRP